MPLIMRFDPLTSSAGAATSSALALNIDIAPTIADVAGVPVTTDGRSLVPILGRRSASWRTRFLIEHMEGTNPVPTYCAVRTDRFLFASYATGERELYDLEADPFRARRTSWTTAPALADELSGELDHALRSRASRLSSARGRRRPRLRSACGALPRDRRPPQSPRRYPMSIGRGRGDLTTTTARPRRSLFLASFLMLFVELALIRGTTAAVVYLSFFTNLVLLASFLGIGLGFLRAQRRAATRCAGRRARCAGDPAVPDRVPGPDRQRGRSRARARSGSAGMHALPEWLSLSLIFVGVALAMTCIAERVGRLFGAFEPLDAYRLDVLGSICGIVVFSRCWRSWTPGRSCGVVDRGAACWRTCCARTLARRSRWRLACPVPAGRRRVAAAERHLVALPARDVRRTRRRPGRDPGEQPARTRRWRRSRTCWPSSRSTRIPYDHLPARTGRRPDRGCRQRQRRRARPVEGRDARGRRGDRPGPAAARDATCTRSIRTRTRA